MGVNRDIFTPQSIRTKKPVRIPVLIGIVAPQNITARVPYVRSALKFAQSHMYAPCINILCHGLLLIQVEMPTNPIILGVNPQQLALTIPKSWAICATVHATQSRFSHTHQVFPCMVGVYACGIPSWHIVFRAKTNLITISYDILLLFYWVTHHQPPFQEN